MIPELHACEEAEDYFAALEVSFDPSVLTAHRIPILRRFGDMLVDISDGHPGADDGTLRSLARAALQEAYHAERLERSSPAASGAAPSCGGCALAAACAPVDQG